MKIGETIFQKNSTEIFNKKSNIEESRHNEKTHKERTKQEEEAKKKVKRISYFLDAFFSLKQRDKIDIFQKEFENTDNWQNVF